MLVVLTGGAAAWSVSSSPDVSMRTSASVATTPSGARLTATPKVVLAGQPVQLSGTDCPRHDEVLTGLTAPVIPDGDGTWKLDETVGITRPDGPQNFGAYCFTRGGGSLVFSYPTAHVRVIMAPSAFRVGALRVSPGPAVTAGTTRLTVHSVGPCPVGAGSSGGSTSGYWAEVTLSEAPDSAAVIARTDSIQQFVSDREWSATLSIPEGLTAGQYIVTAICQIQGLTLGYYSPLSISVTGQGGGASPR
jgi:hypothetical protein